MANCSEPIERQVTARSAPSNVERLATELHLQMRKQLLLQKLDDMAGASAPAAGTGEVGPLAAHPGKRQQAEDERAADELIPPPPPPFPPADGEGNGAAWIPGAVPAVADAPAATRDRARGTENRPLRESRQRRSPYEHMQAKEQQQELALERAIQVH
jgi:hypothetical protein